MKQFDGLICAIRRISNQVSVPVGLVFWPQMDHRNRRPGIAADFSRMYDISRNNGAERQGWIILHD